MPENDELTDRERHALAHSANLMRFIMWFHTDACGDCQQTFNSALFGFAGLAVEYVLHTSPEMFAGFVAFCEQENDGEALPWEVNDLDVQFAAPLRVLAREMNKDD